MVEKLRPFVPYGGRSGKANGVDGTSVIVRPVSAYALELIDWLWDGWLARGKLHVLAGVGGAGKSTIACSVAATISGGGRWPDDTEAPRGDVLIWSGEDGVADTIKPRLLAMRADLDRVQIISGINEDGKPRTFNPATDIKRLHAVAAKMPDLKLLILDPISAAYTGDSHKDAEVRASLAPVIDLAEHKHIAVLGIAHFAKQSAGRSPAERVIGSVAVANAPRLVMAVAKPADQSAPRVLTRAKSNIGPEGGGFEYHLLQLLVSEGAITARAQRIEWGKMLDGDARMLLDIEDPSKQEALDEAGGFLEGLLANGPLGMKEIKSAAEANGHAWRTVERAKAKLQIVATHPNVRGPWFWSLPAPPRAQGRQGEDRPFDLE